MSDFLNRRMRIQIIIEAIQGMKIIAETSAPIMPSCCRSGSVRVIASQIPTYKISAMATKVIRKPIFRIMRGHG